jgi:hypothetical protein
MIKRLEKRGSHVEVIISFIIFVTFVIFLLSILMPTVTTKKDKENTFTDVEIKITDKISSNMTLITINTKDGSDCFDLSNIISDLGIGKNIIVKDYSEKSVEAYSNGDSLRINPWSTGDTFFKIYYSEEFDEIATNSGCDSMDYTVGLIKTNRYIFEKKILDLINTDHETLRNELKISKGIDFGYGIILSNGTAIETNNSDVSTNIYIKETPIEYVDLDGNILEGYLKTKVW